MKRSREFHLHIDHLALDGLSGRQDVFIRALESRLAEWAGSGLMDGVKSSKRRIAQLDAGSMRSGGSPDHMAARVVAAIRNGVINGSEDPSHG